MFGRKLAQRLLVHSLQETRTKLAIDLEDSALDPKHLIRIEHPFVRFVRFVVHLFLRPACSEMAKLSKGKPHVFSLYPVLKIQVIAPRQASMKPKVASRLRPTLTSDFP